jgi:hypothetical protein
MIIHDEIKVAVFSGRNGDCIRLLKNLKYEYKGKIFIVPAGFVSDGASVPQFLWGTISPAIDPRTLDAAIAHDHLYRSHCYDFTRGEADMLFYRLCRAHGLGFWRSVKAYLGVRLFGGKYWTKKGWER